MPLDVAFALRALLLLLGLALLAGAVAACRRGLTPGVRLAVDVALGLYALTFCIGVAALFLWQDALIELYFGGDHAPPAGTPYGTLLLLASAPMLLLPAGALLAQRMLAPTASAAATTALQRAPSRIGAVAVLLGVGVSLAAAWILTGHLLPTLVANTLSELGATSGLVELYARRRELFESLSALQAGMLYGTLPASAALLLFLPAGGAWLVRIAGLALAVSVVVINAGLFQIGPLLAFGLMLVLCAAVRLRGRIRPLHVAVAALAGAALFAVYESLKTSDAESSGPVLQLALRLPIALPYLWEFAAQAPAEVAGSDSLPHDLGEFMFPQLRGPERFVAMPQPGFVEAYFQSGAAAALGVLAALALMAWLGGTALDRLQRRGDVQRPVLVAVLLAPALYYGFQVQLRDVFVSSYGVIFPALPVLAVLVAHALLQLFQPAPRTASASASDPEPGPLPT